MTSAPNNPDCVFCSIVAGRLPCTRIAETERVLAFLDIGPIIKGHTLVIPKAHFDPLTAVPLDLLQEVIAVVQRVAQSQLDGLGADGINLVQSNGACAGQVVPHAHFHVIPRFANDAHRWNWKTTSYQDAAEREAIAARIRMDRGM